MLPPLAPHAGPNPNSQDPTIRKMNQKMAVERNSERQKRIVADTARLLEMAKTLNAEVSRTDKNVLSITVVQQADKIEKLAKTIKQKMRDGY
jgi:hypothetical protein